MVNRRARRMPGRRGVALLACLTLTLVISSLVLNVLLTEALQLAAIRNQIEYERALYLANAGVHHACSNLMSNPAWRGTLTDGVVPPASQPAGYSVTAVDDGLGGVTVLSTGYAGAGKRTVQAQVDP